MIKLFFSSVFLTEQDPIPAGVDITTRRVELARVTVVSIEAGVGFPLSMFLEEPWRYVFKACGARR
ncbi:MAG: hypothetical protein WCI27_06810 [Candidatus Omnitrophota bacterium]